MVGEDADGTCTAVSARWCGSTVAFLAGMALEGVDEVCIKDSDCAPVMPLVPIFFSARELHSVRGFLDQCRG